MLQMKYRKRVYYTEEQKALMWDRWQEGDSIREIAQLFDRLHSSVQGMRAERLSAGPDMIDFQFNF